MISLRLSLALILLLSFNLSAGTEQLRLDGSNGVRPIMEALAAGYGAVEDEPIEVGEGMSVSHRLEALSKGHIDLATASHGIEPERISPYDFQVYQIAKMAIVFAVHNSVSISEISSGDLLKIYTGEHTNWKDLGGQDLSIVPLMRPEDEVDTEKIRELIPGLANAVWSESTVIHSKSGQLAEALNTTPGAIGVTSAARAANSENLNVLSIDDQDPDKESIENGNYSLVRGIYLISPRKPSRSAARFLRFTGVAEGIRIIESTHCISTGLIPLMGSGAHSTVEE